MSYKNSKYTPILFLVILLVFSAFGNKEIQFQKIDMQNGLSSNSVLALLQDSEGYLWIGTRNGLNKYNSLDNEIFRHQFKDSLSLINNQINCLTETKKNVIWIGTENGLNKYNRKTNSFLPYYVTQNAKGISNGYVRCFSESKNGELWIGTAFGLNKYQAKKDEFEHLFLGDSSSLTNNVIALFHDKNDSLWLGTKGGLFIHQNHSFKQIKFSNAINQKPFFEIRDIKQDSKGRMWIATENYGLISFDFIHGKAKNLQYYNSTNSKICSNSVRKILIDSETIWIATTQGVAILKNDKITNLSKNNNQKNEIDNSSIRDIIKDKAGGIFISSYMTGVYYYHKQNNLFNKVSHSNEEINPLTEGVISWFREDSLHNLWIGTGKGGMNYWNPQTHTVLDYITPQKDKLSNGNIKCFEFDNKGNLWIGTYKGLNFYNPQTKTIEKFLHESENKNSLNNNQIHSLKLDKKGLLWIGMNGGEFQTFNPKTKEFKTIKGIGSLVNTLFEDRKEHLWISDRSGLHCLDTKTHKKLNISYLTNNFAEQLCHITSIYEDSQNRLWFATAGFGIILSDSTKTYWFNHTNSPIDNTINAIIEDNEGYFWVSTSKGISRFEFIFEKGKKPKLKITNFELSHGLVGTQFEVKSALKSKKGFIFFGGVNGFNYFKPSETHILDFFPKVVFSMLKINHNSGVPENLDITSKLRTGRNKVVLNFEERNMTIRFAGINFIDSKSTFYRYMMVNADSSWIDLDHQRSINFAYLPVGKHEIRVKASTNAQKWGKEYSRIFIQILPPWWRSWWAYTIYLVIVFFIVRLAFNYSQKWTNMKNSILMEQFKREKEQELHESKLKFFTDISHELRTPLTLILAPLEKIMVYQKIDKELNHQLKLIRKNGDRMMNLINKVLNLRKLETGHEKLRAVKGNFYHFLKEISLAFNEIAKVQAIDFKYISVNENFELWYDSDKMESVIYNLLSNAFKHTEKEGQIRLVLESEIEKGKKHAKISISNTGKGISHENIQHIFERFFTKANADMSTGVGLEITKRIVELHKGKIRVDSRLKTETELGLTTFSVSLPIGKSHLTSEEIISDSKNNQTTSAYTKKLKFKEKIEDLKSVPEVLPQITDKEKQSLLIVEDNQEVRAFICDLFKANYHITEAQNGLLAWGKALELIPDLIISDIMMPEMDGMELCRKLKTELKTSHIPIILLTARATLSFKYEGIKTGADEYITKPFSAEFLTLRVQNLIQQRNTIRSYFAKQIITEPEKITFTSVDEKFLKKAVDYISENMSKSSINVETLSRELGLSRVHFYRKIKSITNQTAVEFIRSIRLKRAAQLLQQKGISIKEVQYKVGFENADYFRKCFKEQFEMTPSEYILINAK